jgi:hypothetical protein
VVLVLHKHGVFHVPLDDLRARGQIAGKAEAAHVHDYFELRPAQVVDGFGEVVAQIYLLFGHDFDGVAGQAMAGARPALAAMMTSDP